MRLIFLPQAPTILLCFVVWPVLQVAAALICLKLPDRCFLPDSFLFRAHRFERQGRIYDSVFRVNRWKHLLPDGGAILNRRGFKKKKLEGVSRAYLNRFCIESARGELSHWLAIVPFWVFGFFAPFEVVGYMLAYALFINLPCIVVQRYNRPRMHRLYLRLLLDGREGQKSTTTKEAHHLSAPAE